MRWIILSSIALLSGAGLAGAADDGASALFDDLRRELPSSVEFETLEEAEMSTLAAAWTDLLVGRAAAEADSRTVAGMVARRAGALWGVREEPPAWRGQGIFLVRPGASRPWLLSAPHAVGDDLLTGEIVLGWFSSTDAVAAAWSDVRRRDADLARETRTAFQALHLAFAAAHPDGLVVQLHGFARDKRSTQAGRDSLAILSTGEASAPPWLERVAACTEVAIRGRVSVYPDEVHELGGTTNAQARALAGRVRFLHLETSLELRRRLRAEPELALAVASCWEEES